MKFNLENAPQMPDESVAVGNVYLSKNSRVTKFWVVLAIRDSTIIMLGLSKDGDITSCTSYGRHMFEDSEWHVGRKPIGRVVDMPNMQFNIEWSSLP